MRTAGAGADLLHHKHALPYPVAVAAAQGANVTTSTASHGIAASCGFSLGSAFRLPTARRGGDCGAGEGRQSAHMPGGPEGLPPLPPLPPS